jgi:hypothetical protein
MGLTTCSLRIRGKGNALEDGTMIRKWYCGIPVVLLAVSVAAVAFAQPLRDAKVGDSMGSLVAGLQKVNAGSLGSCAPGNPVVSLTDYVVQARTPNDDTASFQAFTVGQRMVVLVAYDEDDLSAPVAVYADLDGNGLITNAWPIDKTPTLCAILGNSHYQP